MHGSLGSLEWGAGSPREFEIGMEGSLGLVGMPYSLKAAKFTRESKFAWGCRILY